MLHLLAWFFVASEAATVRLASEDVNRPVTKVINLLKDMSKQLEKEQEEDEEVYEKVACWCETNDKEKTKAIEDAEARITDLTATIEEKTAASSRLNTEIKNLNAEIAKNQESLDKATALRQKQLAEFNAEEKDLLQSIGALKSAVTVLSKHNAPPDSLLNIAAVIQHQFHKHEKMLHLITTVAQRKAVSAFLEQPADYFDAEPTFKQSYAPQSGEIFGILNQMKETFESNLSSSQKEELANQAAYEDLKAAKEAEIKAGEQQRDTKTQELADTDLALAQAKQDLEDTRNSLSADQKFLMNLKETCQMTDQEWEERQKTRQEEIQAVSEALSILSSDDAHDTFTRTFNFVQTSTEKSSNRRDRAAAVLFGAAKKYGNPKLSAIATSVRLDAFTKVKAAIDDMVAALIKEKEDEIKHKDFCTDELNQNERSQELKARDIADLEAKIQDLTTTMENLASSIATLQAEVAEMQVQLKRAGEDREKENSDFQTTVSDQRATQSLLSNALNVLKGFYAKKDAGAFVQKNKQPAGPPPPPGFKSYENQSGNGGVMSMLEQIISEAKTLEADAIKAESDAQKAYESFVMETNSSIESKNEDITNKSAERAQAEADKVAAEQARATALSEDQQLKAGEADLHKSCDFTLDNFDIRQTARDQEVEALRQAKAILSGSNFSEFLQKRM